MTLVKVNNQNAKTFDGFMSDFFNELPSTFNKTTREDSFNSPPVNILEKADSYKIEIAAPGWDKNDFNIKMDGNLLTISSAKKEEVKAENEKIIRKQFSTKYFSRSFTLDDLINAADIAAKYENGVLTVHLPKKEEIKLRTQEITVQ